jgi:hypothetical protein
VHEAINTLSTPQKMHIATQWSSDGKYGGGSAGYMFQSLYEADFDLVSRDYRQIKLFHHLGKHPPPCVMPPFIFSRPPSASFTLAIYTKMLDREAMPLGIIYSLSSHILFG